MAGGPGHQRRIHDPARWLASAEVQRPQSDAYELHRQGHTRPEVAVGAGAVRRDDLHCAGTQRHPFAGVCGRRVPADIETRLEVSGIPSLAFAVGVYLPISSSAPVFVGGLVRWLVDKRLRHQLREHKLTEEELTAEGEIGRA